MPVVELHPEHGVGQRLDDRAFDLDRIFLRQASSDVVSTSGNAPGASPEARSTEYRPRAARTSTRPSNQGRFGENRTYHACARRRSYDNLHMSTGVRYARRTDRTARTILEQPGPVDPRSPACRRGAQRVRRHARRRLGRPGRRLQARHVRSIKRETEQLRDLVTETSILIQIETAASAASSAAAHTSRRPIDLAREAADSVADPQERIKIRAMPGAEEAWVRCDGPQIVRALRTLLLHAGQRAPSGPIDLTLGGDQR